ncbi:MAG: TonB-dependent receptor [Bryobacteraceae bacterium]
MLPARSHLVPVAALAVLSAFEIPAQVRFEGSVSTPTRAPLKDARLLLRPPAEGAVPRQQFTNVQGEFAFDDLTPGNYTLTIELAGYFPVRQELIRVEADMQAAAFVLEPLRDVVTSMSVESTPLSVDMDTSTARRSVSNAEIVNIPYPNSNDFRSALRIVPGIIRDARGGLHINGAAEEQVLFLLNGFNVTDPLTNRFESRLSVESVQSVEVSSGNLPAEYGKGSAGALAIRSHSGADAIRYGATNFIPGVENRKGLIIGDWTPRINLSGPIKKGRAWFANSSDIIYTQTVIRDLPKGEDRNSGWRMSNLLSTQVNLSPSHILHTGFLWNRWQAARTGLSALDPLETTIDRRSRQYFFNIKDQIYLGREALIEFGYAANRTYGREIPQGEELLRYTTDGRRGNYFIDGIRKASRDQFVANGFLPAFEWLGSHQIKTGIDLDRVSYWQNVRRTGFENFDEYNRRTVLTEYGGNGRFRRGNYEAAWFAQDSWRVRPGLLLELGARADWDNLLHRWDASPRAGLAWTPLGWENTKIYGGYARVYDATSLRMFTRPLDQYALTTYFGPDGQFRGPIATQFLITDPSLERPRFTNATAGVEHHFPGSVSFRVELQRRRGSRGFAYMPYFVDEVEAMYHLTNERTDAYDAWSATIRHTIKRQYEWMVSYTRSRALSNNVVDVNVDQPIGVLNNYGRMPWDAPHRLMSWGYLPTPFKNWSVAYLVDSRSGFPYSAQTQFGAVVGQVSAYRFPRFFEANLHVERKFEFRGHRWAFRAGFNNITDRVNPDTVNTIVGSTRYQRFYGGVGRSTNFRIRWLGRI